MRIWGRVGLGGIAVLASSLFITVPAGAASSHPGGVSDTCPEVLAGAPGGGLEKVTEPADGSDVRHGAVVAVTLRWDTTTFTSPVLHKALDCVTVDGTPVDQLSTQERDTANDGRFDYRFTVPDNLADGTRLCDRGFVSGPDGENGFNREKSNDVCFTVRGEAPTPTSSLASPADTAIPSPAPIPLGPAGRGTPGTDIAPDTTVLGQQQQHVLPRTGSSVEGPLRLGSLALLLGGICMLAGGRRRRTFGPSGHR
ncbi:MAG TPA: hypothetical protein VEN99_04955 [Acidimicrobiia bacterium]|nr:hypothetical protein [Acidimicrobiia bacterium]